MLPLEAITPTLYAFAEAFAQKVFSERKDSLRKFLNQEERIYEIVFKFYVFSDQMGLAKDESHRYFAEYLSNKQILDDEEERIKALSRPVHDEYWRMAQSDCYWLDGKRRDKDGIDKYSIVVAKWRQNETKRLEDRQEFMSQLRSTLGG